MNKKIQKIYLLIWKNYLIQKRHPVRTLIELMLPVLMTVVLIVLRSWVTAVVIPESTHFPSFNLHHCLGIMFNKTWDIAWSPSTDETASSIMKFVIENNHFNNSFAFKNEKEMERKLSSRNIMDSILAGISFDDSILPNKTFSSHMKVKFRFPGLSRVPLPNSSTLDTQIPNWRTHLIFPLYQPFGPRDSLSVTGGEPGYCEEGFLKLQHDVFAATLNHYNASDILEDPVNITRFPYPSYTLDPLLPALTSFISIFLLISFVFTAINTIKLVTTEKETQMKEAMKLMGLSNWMHWTAWYLKEIIQWMIPIVIIAFLLTYQWSQGYIINKSDPLLLLFILFLYSVASIAFCFLVSVCFNKANSAATIGGALWFLQYSPYLILQPKYVTMTWGQIMFCSILSNTNMGYIWQIIVTYEGADEGLHWNNMFQLVSPSDKVTIGDLLIMLIVDAAVYMALTIYIEGAFPGKYGVSLPWYFPFQATYWLGYEKNRCDARPIKGIQIKNLTKIYADGKLAVHDLNLDLYPNQITVLLGHNGAGKSSTMSMLTGLIRPTSGTAIINGYDIWSEMSKIRDGLGLCPQYNLLFAELTIREHLQFFGRLKGVSGEILDSEINRYVKHLELESKLDELACTLSGGYERRLSVAIALAGKSKVVLLDEPTSGMDPSARRSLWDLLQVERHGRTVVMTTHLMDEADLLGDRVAILSGGQLKCVGTPFMLKKKYGHGYTLSLVKSKINDYRDEKITAFLQSFYPDLYPSANTETELKYKLDDAIQFPSLLGALSQEQESLGIKAYGISLTTMEDVYMSVGIDHRLPDVTQENVSNKMSISSSVAVGSVSLPPSVCPLFQSQQSRRTLRHWIRQFNAMLKKKFLISLRSWFLHLAQILITFSFLIIALIVSISWRGNTDLSPLNLSLKQYRDPVAVFVNYTGDIVAEDAYNSISEAINGTAKTVITNTNNIEEFLLEQYNKSIYDVNQRYMMAIDVNSTNANLYFNAQPYHSLPTAVNILHNAILKHEVGSEYTMDIINYPLKFLPSEMVAKLEGGSNLGFQVAFNTGFAQAFVCAIFLLITVKEHESGAKHLQFVSGVSPLAYWSASVLWDYAVYTTPIATLVVTLYAYQDEAFSDTEQLGQLLSLMLAFNWAFVPVMNIASYLFRTPSLAFTAISLFNALTGCATILLVLILEIRPLRLLDEADAIDAVMIIFPHYALCNGLRNIYLSHDMAASCKGDLNAMATECKDWKGNHYSWERPGIGRNLVVLFLVGFIFNVSLLSVEYFINKWKKFVNISKKYWEHLRTRPGIENELKDTNMGFDETDVVSEKQIVQKSSTSEYCIIMKDVWKWYGNFNAVKKVNLALRPYECFALLGSNGAGKTSTFKMLTCKSDVSSGNIYICSLDIRREKDKVSQIIGYCPQFDALINQLTGRETLKMFCTLRGIPSIEHSLVISQLTNRLLLHKFLDIKVGNYSGGNRRKLSTAVAMVGDPPILLLDEPTSGMDPEARRHLWNAINEERERGKCILITTHSLEECEALCTRLAIMVDGKIRCIGSVQHLKSKYATGYKLHIKFPPNAQQNIKWFITTSLAGSEINEEYEGMLLFHIPKDISCSKVFTVMERAKAESLIEDYSIQQTSLEQVFLQLTQK